MAGPRPAAHAVSETLDGQTVIADTAGSELLTLNEVGSLVWQALDGERDLDAIVAHLLPDVSGVTEDRLRADVDVFLTELRSLGLLAEP